jgi:protein-S-isoprenylcysteine O-methyltransferase Ste14
MSSDASPTRSTPAPQWAQRLRRFNQWCMFDLGGGPRPFKLAWIINLQKGGSFAFFALLIGYYADQTPAATAAPALVYLALHGSYGLNWLMKDLLFPDPNWQGRATLASCLFGVIGLGFYWLAGWLVISGTSSLNYPLPEPLWLALCISLCLLGCIIMTAADVQKFCTLKLKRGLITDGMFKYVRHPNYLGEMMIYGALALLAWHWAPLLVLAWYWGLMFSTNMAMKEASMSRHPEWAAYKKRSWWLIPGVF